MATLAESVANWLGRVELLARGADEERREALRALERGDPLAAREHAQALLMKVPDSPVGLAILVDACESLWLDEEAAAALRKLCASAPWRGELWVRLADVLERLGEPAEEVARVLENALEPDTEPAARRRALCYRSRTLIYRSVTLGGRVDGSIRCAFTAMRRMLRCEGSNSG